MSKSRVKILFFVLLISGVTFSQSKKKLQEERIKLKEELEFVNKLLEESQKKSKLSSYQINALQKKISIRKHLITKTSKEIVLVNKRIDDLQEKSFLLRQELILLKEKYSKTIVNTYKSKSYSKNKILLFIISSESIYQGFKRLLYVKKILQIQNEKAKYIQEKMSEYSNTIVELEKIIEEKTSLLQSEKNEKFVLEREQNQEKTLITKISKQQNKLRSRLDKIERETKNLEKKIKEIITKEVALEKRKKYKDESYTRDNNSLTVAFEKQKGKLPWPSQKVFLYMGYGKQKDPVLKGIYRENPGITLGTDKDAEVLSMFDGEVSNIIIIPGNDLSVILKHGEYFTTYSNLSKVFIKKGQKIKQGQKIGVVHYDSNEHKSLMNILIYKGFKQLDPTEWVYKME